MSRIHFIGGEKGGVGKSVMARVLAQYYIDLEIPFRAFDADLSHGAMSRYYADYTETVDLSRFVSADRIVEQTLETGLTTIVDMAAQAARALERWSSEAGLLELAAEMDLNLTFWHVMDDGSDSLKLLRKLLDSYGENASYVVVRNFGRGGDFTPFDTSETAKQAREMGVSFLDLPGLHPPTMRKIDHIDASFWAAINNTRNASGPTLGLLERQRVKTWLNRCYAQLERLHEAFSPEG
jgi:hypothetical protein